MVTGLLCLLGWHSGSDCRLGCGFLDGIGSGLELRRRGMASGVGKLVESCGFGGNVRGTW